MARVRVRLSVQSTHSEYMDWKGARDNGLTTAKITGEVNFIWVVVPKKIAVKISNRDTTTCIAIHCWSRTHDNAL